jgi:hypothetical protein
LDQGTNSGEPSESRKLSHHRAAGYSRRHSQIANVIARNEIRETRRPPEGVGVLLEAETLDIRLSGNSSEGYSQPLIDLHKKQ